MQAWKHFKTITAHRRIVIKHCFKCGIGWRGLMHDLSKYGPEEFFVGARHYLGDRSPNEGERADYGYSKAWMHHKGRNKHHFEYWADYDPKTRVMTPVKMPLKYVIEMFCDRVAASKIYRGKSYTDADALNYFMRGTKTRAIHPDTSALLLKLLNMLAEKGEEETFAYVRRLIQKGDY
ncbi:MAG: catalase [Oscillospiraceae bacterium]|nr:catalase [Oscillospiraceae bacterium]